MGAIASTTIAMEHRMRTASTDAIVWTIIATGQSMRTASMDAMESTRTAMADR